MDNNTGNEPAEGGTAWFVANDLLKSLAMTPAPLTLSDPLTCVDVASIPPADLAYLALVSGAFATIRDVISKLSSESVSELLGFSKFSASDALMILYGVLNGMVPNIPIPSASFGADFVKMVKQAVKSVITVDMPKAVMPVPLVPQIKLDLNIVKPVIIAALDGSIDGIMRSLPFDPTTPAFPNISAADIKVAVKAAVDGAMELVLNIVKPAYEAYYATASLVRLAGISRSALDQALSPVETAATQAYAAAIAPFQSPQNPLTSSMTVPPQALQEAMSILDNVPPLPYVAVLFAASIGAGDAIRDLHPLIYQDDIPPWERLNDKNNLFFLFLDDFCHNGKMYGGFMENYLP
jgi:hypothetical protein